MQAVDKARQLVENDGIQVMLGPIFSPSNAAVTDYLAKGGGGIPSISIFGQPSDNLKTGNDLSFIPAGMFSHGGLPARQVRGRRPWATRRPTRSASRTPPGTSS